MKPTFTVSFALAGAAMAAAASAASPTETNVFPIGRICPSWRTAWVAGGRYGVARPQACSRRSQDRTSAGRLKRPVSQVVGLRADAALELAPPQAPRLGEPRTPGVPEPLQREPYQNLAAGAAAGAGVLAAVAALATRGAPRWVRATVVMVAIVVACGIGIYTYRIMAQPTTLTVAAG